MSSEEASIKHGKINLISKDKRSEIKYVYVCKDYFKKGNLKNDKKIKKIFNALDIKIPDMIFKVPSSSWPSEYFIHDISKNFDMSFTKAVEEYNLEPLLNLEEIKKKFSSGRRSNEILWSYKLNKYLIDELNKYRNHKNILENDKHNLFLNKLKDLEYDRAIVKDKLKKIIRSLSEVFNQANSIIWMKHKKNDFGGDFVAKNCNKSTVILGDCVLNEKFHVDPSDIHKIIDDYISKDYILQNNRKELSSYFFTNELFKKIKENSKPYSSDYENAIDTLNINVEDEIKKVEEICIKYVSEKSIDDLSNNNNLAEIKKDISKNEHILVRSYASNFDHICNFQMIPKNSLTHLIYWEDENDFLSWKSHLKDLFPVGVLLIGCKKAGLEHAKECLKDRLPFFVFDKTGGSASIISKMIKKYNKNENDSEKKDNNKSKSSWRICGSNTVDISNNNSDLSGSNNCNFLWNLCCKNNTNSVEYYNKEENDCSNIFIGRHKKYCLDEDDFENIERSSQIIFKDWYKYYNKDSVYIIDPFELNIEKLQDKVNKTMNVAFDYDMELRSEKDDKIRLKYAWIQFETLKNNAKILKFWSLLYFIGIGISIFATSVVSTINSIYSISIINILSIILPILTGILLTLFYTFKPVQRWATSEIGRRMIIAEIYKFRTRTGIYHVSRRCNDKKIKECKARELFSEELIKIWKNLELSDFKLSSLKVISENKFKDIIEKQKILEQKLFEIKSYEVDLEEGNPKYLDPLEKMSVEDYVKVRLDSIILKNKKKAPKIETTVKLLQFFIFILTASGAVLTHFKLSIFVPNVLALSTMISTIMEQEQLIVKLSSTNGIYMQLEQLKCYWQGLSLVDKRKPSNSNYIVENTESILISQLSSYVQAVKSVNEKDDD